MKFTLRITLLAILVTLLVITVAGLGFSSYRNARFTADDLSTQILEQTTLRIDHQINNELLNASEEGTLELQLLKSGLFSLNDFPRLGSYWLEILKAYPGLTRISIGLEADGERYHVRRLHDGKLAIMEVRKNHQTGKLELRSYWPADYARKPFFVNVDADTEDARTRPWYVAARKAGRQAWSETHPFFGAEGALEVPGVSCALPVYRDDGSLLGVLEAGIDLYKLCQFLKNLAVGRSGFAFVVEYRADGSRRVIAHPNPEILLRVLRDDGTQCVSELGPAESLSDECVKVFLNQVPAGVLPADLQGMARISFAANGVRYLGAYQCLSSKETPDWLICTILPESDVMERVERSNRETLFVALCVLVVAVAVSLYISAQVARPLEQLAGEAAAIGRLQVEARPVAHSVVLEVDRLAVAMEEMKTGLRSFQKYVPSELVRSLLTAGGDARRGGERRTVTISFCDVADFTSISEGMAPEEVVEQLGEYFGALSAQICERGAPSTSTWAMPSWLFGGLLARTRSMPSPLAPPHCGVETSWRSCVANGEQTAGRPFGPARGSTPAKS